MQEIGGKTTIKSLLKISLESIGTMSARRTAIFVWILVDDGIQSHAVCGSDVLYISDILQASLNLE